MECTAEELSEVLHTKTFIEACKKYGDGTTDATRFVKTCFACNIKPLPGEYIISEPPGEYIISEGIVRNKKEA